MWKASGCFEFNWEYIFFQGQFAIMELCYSLWLPDHWQNAHTHKPHMCTWHGCVKMWLHNINKIFRVKIRVKRHQTPKSRWYYHFLCISLPFSMAQQLCLLHYGLAKSVVKEMWWTYKNKNYEDFTVTRTSQHDAVAKQVSVKANKEQLEKWHRNKDSGCSFKKKTRLTAAALFNFKWTGRIWM